MLETKKGRSVGLDKESKTRKIMSNTLLRAVLIVATILVLVPILWTIMSSFKTSKEFYSSPWSFPESLSLKNYVTAFTEANMGRYFFNSIFVTAIAIVISLCLSVPASYVLAREKFFGCNLIRNLFMGGLFIQGAYIIVPLFTMLDKMNLLNNLLVLAFIYGVLSIPFSTYIISGFMKGVAKDYEEAARIDGCSNFQILTRIVVPLAKPGIITITIFNFMSFWNEYAMSMTFITDAEKKTLSVGLQNLMEVQKFATDWGALFAGLVIVMLPTMIIYSLVHKKLTEGVNIGGIKG